MHRDPTILLVDDNLPALKATTRILRQAGYLVTQAANGTDALHQVREQRPDLVLLDVVLPDISGNEVLRQIRADPALAGVSVVMLSSQQTLPEQQAEGLDGGADGYIARPIATTELLARIRSQFRQRDLTEKLRESENLFSAAFRSSPAGIAISRRSDLVNIEVNEAFLQMHEISREDIVGRSLLDAGLIDSNSVDAMCNRLDATGSVINEEMEIRTHTGKALHVILSVKVIQLHGEACNISTLIDITERKNLEQRLLRAQRMESIGTLAGGIAHNLNNVLAPIIMSLDLFKMRFPDPESRELLGIISTNAQRGADMVRQVLSFARGVEGPRTEAQPGDLIREIEKIANETFPKDIVVRTNVPAGLRPVLGDATQLHQVLLNLCVNARDAMPGGGTLTLSAEDLAIDEDFAGMNPDAQAGQHVLVRIEDSGTGIPPDVIGKIFDPFFTTKEVGKGTGLGLSTSFAIVKSHGGFIRVESQPGKGTCFKVHLPAMTGSPRAAACEAMQAFPRGHGELILVVDDEASVRKITRLTLQNFGYRVVLASDGTDALAIYANKREEIAAVLIDMAMPVMDGPTTIQNLLKMDPDLRIIAASGLTSENHLALGFGVRRFLPKPYTVETLLTTLQEALAG